MRKLIACSSSVMSRFTIPGACSFSAAAAQLTCGTTPRSRLTMPLPSPEGLTRPIRQERDRPHQEPDGQTEHLNRKKLQNEEKHDPDPEEAKERTAYEAGENPCRLRGDSAGNRLAQQLQVRDRDPTADRIAHRPTPPAPDQRKKETAPDKDKGGSVRPPAERLGIALPTRPFRGSPRPKAP